MSHALQVFYFRQPKAVDALVRVTNNSNSSIPLSKETHQFILNIVGVLELNKNGLNTGYTCRMFSKKVTTSQEKVVVVKKIQCIEGVFILCIYIGKFLLVGLLPSCDVFVTTDAAGFETRYP